MSVFSSIVTESRLYSWALTSEKEKGGGPAVEGGKGEIALIQLHGQTKTQGLTGDPVSFCPVEDNVYNPLFFLSSISLCNVTSQLILIERFKGKVCFFSSLEFGLVL